jgi:hypothetical protein
MNPLRRWFGPRRTSKSTGAPIRFRPRLEGLEDRQMLSASASLQADGVYIRYTNGQLWEHTSKGFRFIDVNTASVSSGLDTFGNPAAFIIRNNGQLVEYSPAIGYRLIDVNVVRASASQTQRDTVFMVYINGMVYEHTGASAAAGFHLIDGNAIDVSAGKDSLGAPAVFVTYVNNQVYEYSTNIGFHFIDWNVVSLSASQTQADTAFIVYDNSYLYEHVGNSHASGFILIDVNAVDVSAGQDTTGVPAVFVRYNNNAVFEWSAALGFRFIDINALSISASQQEKDTVFVVYDNNMLFEHIGLSATAGFRFVDMNVEP